MENLQEMATAQRANQYSEYKNGYDQGLYDGMKNIYNNDSVGPYFDGYGEGEKVGGTHTNFKY